MSGTAAVEGKVVSEKDEPILFRNRNEPPTLSLYFPRYRSMCRSKSRDWDLVVSLGTATWKASHNQFHKGSCEWRNWQSLNRLALSMPKSRCQRVFVAFDLLFLNGKDLRTLPLIEWKALSAVSSQRSKRVQKCSALCKKRPNVSDRFFEWAWVAGIVRRPVDLIAIIACNNLAQHPPPTEEGLLKDTRQYGGA
jgi:hypothetical protein